VENERAKTEAYERRRDLNRDARTVEAQLAAIPEFGPEVPDVEVSLSNLSKEIGTVREQKLAIEEQLHKVDRLRSNIEMRSTTIAEHKQKIEDLKTTIASLEAAQKADERLIDESANVGAEGDILDDQIQKLEQQIAGAEQLNKKIRAKQNRGKGVRKLNELKAKAEEEAVRIEDLERQRAEALARVEYPIKGMSVTPDGVFIGDVPFSQASTAEQIRVGIALAAAANPALKLAFVRDGSLLDAKSMESVAEIARLYGMQVLIERVDDNSPTAIEIVDGTTVGADDEAPDEESEPENVAATQQKRGRKPIAAAGITMEF
jgi:predicted  nucleic acid-binding Zn-ribbon protein